MVCAAIHHMLPAGKRGVGSPCSMLPSMGLHSQTQLKRLSNSSSSSSMTGPDARWTSQKPGSWREVRCLGCRARHPLCLSAIWAHWVFPETNLPAHTFPQADSAAKLLVTALPRLRTMQSSAWTSFFLYFPVFHIKGPRKAALNTAR